MLELGEPLIRHDCCPYKGTFGHRDGHRGKTTWKIQGVDRHLQAKASSWGRSSAHCPQKTPALGS